jgi:putative salt-induced outer membrane protein YdiY
MIKRFGRLLFNSAWAILLLTFSFSNVGLAQKVVVHLKGGDLVSGFIISETLNEVVISNAWTKSLTIPLEEITRREIEVETPSLTEQSKTATSSTNTITAATAISKPPAKPKSTCEIRIGLDAIVSTTDQQDYSGHLKLTYERPYASYPLEFFKNTSIFDGEYQKTDGQESANRANASNKSDLDMTKNVYGYGMVGAGFDEVQKINFEYQFGPGLGLHLIQHTNFLMNLESGLDYQYEYRQDTSNLKTFS